MSLLSQLERASIYLIREGYGLARRPAVLWSCGKDSTVLLWLMRKAFAGAVPFPVVHIDTSYKFSEVYRFRDRWARQWSIDLHVVRNDAALAAGMSFRAGRLECCHGLKTQTLLDYVKRAEVDALYVGIRGDEHGVRGKEYTFSPRDAAGRPALGKQPPALFDTPVAGFAGPDGAHLRIHPLLRWTERDVWAYIAREDIPVVPLYYAQGGARYRSIGCACCCSAVSSSAASPRDVLRELAANRSSERAGRAQDKEDPANMEKLRSLGYM